MALTRRFSLLIRRLLPNPETVHRPRHAASCAGERSSDRAWRPRRHARLLPRHLRLPHLLMRGRQPDECSPIRCVTLSSNGSDMCPGAGAAGRRGSLPRDPQPPSPRRGTSGRRRVAPRVAACPARRRRPCCGGGRHSGVEVVTGGILHLGSRMLDSPPGTAVRLPRTPTDTAVPGGGRKGHPIRGMAEPGRVSMDPAVTANQRAGMAPQRSEGLTRGARRRPAFRAAPKGDAK